MVNNIGQIDVKINTSDIGKAITELNELGKAASNAQSRLDGMSRINLSGLTGQVSALNRELSSVDKTAAGAAKSIGGIASKSLGGLSQQITIINNNFSQTSTTINQLSQQFNQFNSISAGAGAVVSEFAAKLLKIGMAVKVAQEVGEAVYKMGKYLYDAYQPVQALTMGLNAMGKSGAAELSVMRAQASSLGVVFSDTAKSQLAWQASIQQTSLEGEKGAKVFNSISGAIRLFGGGTEEVNGALKALTQMMSKGTVQSEELKGQLGERLPGTFKMMADSLGISTRELNDALKNGMVESGFAIEKLAELIEKRYGEGITNAANTTQAQINRMRNDWDSIAAGIGRAIDALVGKAATFINKWGILRGIAENFDAGATRDNIKADGVRDGTGTAKANRMLDDANTLLAAKGQAPLKAKVIDGREGGQRRIKYEDAATVFGRELAEAISKLSNLAAVGDTRSKEYKDLETRIKIIKESINNNKDIKQQGADRSAADVRARKEAADFADDSRASQARQEAIRSGDRRALLALDIEKARKDIEAAAKTMSGMALGEFKNKKLEYIASREAEISKLDKKEAKAGARAASAVDLQVKQAGDVVGRGGDTLAKLQEQFLTLQDPEGIEGKVEQVRRTYAKLRDDIGKLNLISAKERTSALASIDAQEQDAIAQLRKNDKLQDSIKARKKIEQEINDIIKQREGFSVEADNKIAKMRFDLGVLNTKSAKDNQDYYVQSTDTSSAYAKAKKEFLNKATKPYDDMVANIDEEMLSTDLHKTKLLRQRDSLVARIGEGGDVSALQQQLEELDKSLTNIDDKIREMREHRDNINGTDGLKGSRYMANAEAESFFEKQRKTTGRLDWGVDRGAQDYVDTIKGKAERAKEVMGQFGQTMTDVLTSSSWSSAKDTAKSFFASLLKQIQQTIVQLMIVKPLIQSISNMAGESWQGSGSGGGLFGSVLRFLGGAVGGGVSSTPTTTSGTPSIGEFAANGGVWASGQKINYYANGGVFDRPTAFGMSTGVGVLGERGAEAVMPLKRDAKGRLGVAGGSSTNINNQLSITVNGNADADTIKEMEMRLAKQMTEISRQQANNAVLQANRPGGANYRK